MVISVKNLTTVIDCCLPTAGVGTILCCQLEGAQSILQNNVVYSVPTLADLPDPTANTGRFIYVNDINEYRYSNCYVWTADFDTTVEAYANVLWTWGSNLNGVLGTGNSNATSRSSPGTTAGGGITWCQIGGIGYIANALKTDGTLWTWGSNNYGELGDNSKVNRSSPGTTAGGGTDWCQVSGGIQHTAAVKTDGTLWTWGCNGQGRLGDNSSVNRSSPGTTAGGGTTWCQVSLGNIHSAAVKTDGTLWTWGYNGSGRLGDNSISTKSSPVTTAGGGTTWHQVSLGNIHSAAVKTDGTLWTWGYNGGGQLGDNSTLARSSPGTTVGGGTTWCQVRSGISHNAAIKTDGTLWTWGCNSCGKLGNGFTATLRSPGTTAGGGTNWCQVSGGNSNTAAVKTDGTLWTWGSNVLGQLGNNSITNRSSPGTTAGGGTNWCQVSAGLTGAGDGSNTAAITADQKGFIV